MFCVCFSKDTLCKAGSLRGKKGFLGINSQLNICETWRAEQSCDKNTPVQDTSSLLSSGNLKGRALAEI